MGKKDLLNQNYRIHDTQIKTACQKLWEIIEVVITEKSKASKFTLLNITK